MDVHTSPIAVLGAGAWGTALAIHLARNGQPVRLWDIDADLIQSMQKERMQPSRLSGIPLPSLLEPVVALKDAVNNVQDICLVVPSFAFKKVLEEIKPLVAKDVRFVWGTKGLNPENAGFLHELVVEVFSKSTPMAVLSGPSFAKEVANDLPTAVSVAGNDHAFLESLCARLRSDTFRAYINPDLIGVQLCGVVKNVMAIGTGMLDGMGFGANTRCALITNGLSEMAQLCVALGGQRETVLSLAGVGDLILTCTDNQSRNRRLGLALGSGDAAESALKSIGQSVEGYYNAKQLYELAKRHDVMMPIAQCVYQILYEGIPAHRLPRALFESAAI